MSGADRRSDRREDGRNKELEVQEYLRPKIPPPLPKGARPHPDKMIGKAPLNK